VSPAATLAELLAPLRADPARSAILLDVDGTLAPIVRHASDAAVPEPTRAVLIQTAKRFGLVACISGRRAAEARRIVSIGSIAYVGNHGAELLLAGTREPELDPELESWSDRVHGFVRATESPLLAQLRVNVEDKGPIAAYHWRGVPDEDAARELLEEIARDAEGHGLATHWGRKVLEIRPPVAVDKGAGIRRLFSHFAPSAPTGEPLDAALYAGDDVTDIDAFRALAELTAEGRLQTCVRVAVTSEEGPVELAAAADLQVDGPAGVRAMLGALLE
jgi:trehalose 6-phosphate phosphatase